MHTTAETTTSHEPSGGAPTPRRDLADVATLVLGVGWAVVVVADGSPLWRLLRVVVVLAATAGVLLLARRHPGRGVEVLHVVLGTAGSAAGLVLGVRFALETGLSATAAGGLVVLVAGGTLLVIGTARLLRSTHGWWRLLAVPVALVLLATVAVPVAIALFATNVPRPSLGTATPADHGLAYDDVAFETADGVTLRGWVIPSQNGAAVVLAHGASSTRTAVLPQAAALADAGYGVLLFDARGHGDSDGRAMELGWYGDLDVAAAVDHLAGRDDVDARRIGAVGMSMGGEEVIGAAAADPRIRIVVAEGATNRTFEDRAWLPTGPNGWLQRGIDALAYGLTDLLTEADPPISLRDAVATTSPRPVVLLAGTGEEDAAAHIAGGAPETVTVVATGAGHTAGLRADPEAWEAAVVGALDRELAAATS